MSCIRRARVPVPYAARALRIARTDGLGDHFTVQPFTPAATLAAQQQRDGDEPLEDAPERALGDWRVQLATGSDGYVEHDHRERNHQGLDNQLLQRPPPPARSGADVQRRERLGGLLSFYYREAA